jgi:hypothetical protein
MENATIPKAAETAKASAPAAGLRRTSILSGAAEAAIDVRKACNAVKRASSLAVASMFSKADPQVLAAAAQAMALDILKQIGVDVADEARVASVMPMMLEATSLVLADTLRHAQDAALDAHSLAEATKRGAATLGAVVKSRAVAKLIEPDWPADIDSITSLRLVASSAMAHVAVEVADFDYMHPQADCIREAGRVVVRIATETARQMAPAQASAAVRLMYTQSLITSGARLYAATWRSMALDKAADLDAMPDDVREQALQAMEAASLAVLLAPLHERFETTFRAINAAAAEMFLRAPDAQAAPPAAALRTRAFVSAPAASSRRVATAAAPSPASVSVTEENTAPSSRRYLRR